MGWKKALFFGGAVLVLAACSDSATAPSALRQANAPSAKSELDPWAMTTSTTDSTVIEVPILIIDPLCTGIVIRTGIDGSSSSTSCTGGW